MDEILGLNLRVDRLKGVIPATTSHRLSVIFGKPNEAEKAARQILTVPELRPVAGFPVMDQVAANTHLKARNRRARHKRLVDHERARLLDRGTREYVCRAVGVRQSIPVEIPDELSFEWKIEERPTPRIHEENIVSLLLIE